jgi:putative redox protein
MPLKTVAVEIKQGNAFHTVCQAGKHTVIIDQPAAAGGTNTGPTPLDYQLIAFGGCITAIGRIMANQRRLAVHSIYVNVTGEINTDRLLGKSADVRAGFSKIHADVSIDADLTPEEKAKFLEEIDKRCPISCNLQTGTAVTVKLAS